MGKGIYKYIKKIFFNIRRYIGVFYHNIHLINPFGLKGILYLIRLKYLKIVSIDSWGYDLKIKEFIGSYLYNKYSHLIDKKNIYPISDNTINKTIWVFWWQGKDNMPLIVQKCYNSIIKYSNGANVILITKYNYKKYIEIPEIMIYKLNKGIICHAHFSDIYRVCLLEKYGGLWLDATIFVTSPIDNSIFDQTFFSMKKDPSDGMSFNSRYSSFCFGCKPHNILFRNLKTLFLSYIENDKYFVDYFTFDYFIRMVCDEIPECKKMVDSLVYNHPNQLSIQLNFDNLFDKKKYDSWLMDTSFHKLTYKGKHYETINGKQTYYGYILRNI